MITVADDNDGLTEAQRADLARRRTEDFKFMVLCASKNNMAMYQLMRDRGLDEYRTKPNENQ